MHTLTWDGLISHPLAGPLLVGYAALIGAAVGSFINVVLVRLPRGESIVRPRSRCPGCQTPIAWYDNLPILSYLLLRGRCRHCQKPIAVRYLTVELLMAAISAGLILRLGVGWELLFWWPLTAALLAIAFLDIDHFWVPDVITFPAMAWALAAAALLPQRFGVVQALLGVTPALVLFVVGVLFERVTGREGLGLGDVKLFAVIGLAVGLGDALAVLLLASVQGAAVGTLVRLTGGHRAKTQDEPELMTTSEVASPEVASEEPDPDADWEPPPGAFPFGPFLVLAALEWLFLPQLFGDLIWRLSEWMVGAG